MGCGNTVVVKGTAKLADGRPLENGRVLFSNDKEQFTADIKPGGTFSPGKYKDGDGIPSGVYKIVITGAYAQGESASSKPSTSGMPSPEEIRRLRKARVAAALIHSKYEDPNTSGLTIDTSKTKTLDLVLDAPQ